MAARKLVEKPHVWEAVNLENDDDGKVHLTNTVTGETRVLTTDEVKEYFTGTSRATSDNAENANPVNPAPGEATPVPRNN